MEAYFVGTDGSDEETFISEAARNGPSK